MGVPRGSLEHPYSQEHIQRDCVVLASIPATETVEKWQFPCRVPRGSMRGSLGGPQNIQANMSLPVSETAQK